MADEFKKMLDDKEKVQLMIAAVVMLGGLVVLLKALQRVRQWAKNG